MCVRACVEGGGSRWRERRGRRRDKVRAQKGKMREWEGDGKKGVGIKVLVRGPLRCQQGGHDRGGQVDTAGSLRRSR